MRRQNPDKGDKDMNEYKDDLKCDKIIDDNGIIRKCSKSPARKLPIFNKNLCKEHQKKFTEFICDQLGEPYEDEI